MSGYPKDRDPESGQVEVGGLGTGALPMPAPGTLQAWDDPGGKRPVTVLPGGASFLVGHGAVLPGMNIHGMARSTAAP